MAFTAVTSAQAELIKSLTQDDIPVKLRCAHCLMLALNALRMPCCDQSICENCQSKIQDACLVCEHSPISSDDCKPNKSLRTTVKVFLRTEEKKRESLRLKEAKNTPPITSIEPVPTPSEAPTLAPPIVEPTLEVQIDAREEAQPSTEQTGEPAAIAEDTARAQQAEQDIPQPSIEEIAPGQEPTQDGDANQAEDMTAEDGEGQIAQTDPNGQPVGQDVSQNSGFGAGFGFDANAAGSFPGMGIGGDFNQMQMMMAMQNGMGSNGFGSFPMMGMPGMGMDPMAMQNMMMSGGFGAGMGMNGMGMGMGIAGFDGGAGTGFNNGWNAQQSWNVGQDNFNNPNAAGMGHGDYSSNNSGFTPNSASYNQGNYGHGNQYNNYQNNSYGYRGRGRGRGYGRGGYGYGSNDHFSQQFPQQFGSSQGQQAVGPISEIGSIPIGPKTNTAAAAANANAGDVDEFGREIRHTSNTKDVAQAEAADEFKPDNTPAAENGTTEDSEKVEAKQEAKDVPKDIDDSAPKPIQTLDEAQAVANVPNGVYNGSSSRGGFSNVQAPFVKPVDVPINAPTGPKAMRAGLPNTGRSGLIAGQQFSIAGRATPGVRINGSASVAPEPTLSEKVGKDRERSRSPTRERSRSRERKRSRSRDRHSRRHRHRSTSRSEDENETERRRQRRRERRRHHDEEGDDREDIPLEEPIDDDVKENRVEEERSRSASPSESKRSSHRSRREKEKYRERDRDDRDKHRERDDDREHKSSHKHRSSRRHHDDRSRSRERSRDRDREHRHRHSRRASEDVDDTASKVDKSLPPTPVEEVPPRRPSVIVNGAKGIEIRGASSRRKNSTIVEEIVIPTGPRSDRPANRDREKEKSGRYREEDESRHHSSRHRDSDRSREKEREKEREKSKENERPQITPTAPAVQDPHTLEREARNRERLLKEAQRIAGLTGQAGGRKHDRDDGEDASGRKGRKKRGRGGDESDEARIARLEAERESARWG